MTTKMNDPKSVEGKTAADVRKELELAATKLAELKAAEKAALKTEREAKKLAEKTEKEAKAVTDKAAGVVPEKKAKAEPKPKVDVLALALSAILGVEGVENDVKALFTNAILAAMPKTEETKPKVEGDGVIKTIVKIIKEANVETGISKNDILKELVNHFPTRDQFSMVSTVRALLIPSRIKKEGFNIVCLSNGNFVTPPQGEEPKTEESK